MGLELFNARLVEAQVLRDEMSFILTSWLVQEQSSVIQREPGPSASRFSRPRTVLVQPETIHYAETFTAMHAPSVAEHWNL